jgi:hypothetical protein
MSTCNRLHLENTRILTDHAQKSPRTWYISMSIISITVIQLYINDMWGWESLEYFAPSFLGFYFE